MEDPLIEAAIDKRLQLEPKVELPVKSSMCGKQFNAG